MNKTFSNTHRQGQAMILTVLVLSSTVLALSAIGGYTMLIRLRVSSDVMSTTRAIYIADAGLECAAYKHFKDAAIVCDAPPYNQFLYAGPSDNASYETIEEPSSIRSIGAFRSLNRSFRMDF